MTVIETIEDAVKNASIAYQFAPNSYTYEALNRCLAMKGALERVIGPIDALGKSSSTPLTNNEFRPH